MTRRILLTVLIVVLAGALLGCYFYFVGTLSAEGRAATRCNRVDVILLDSLESAIVDRQEVRAFLEARSLGRQTDRVDLDSIERVLRARGDVLGAEVYAADDQTVAARLVQRKPVLRLETATGRWYSDPEGFLFPVTHAVDVPVITGHIPLTLSGAYKGQTQPEKLGWVLGLVDLARYIDSKEVLRREIAQIDIAEDGDIVLYTRSAGPAVIFGDCSDIPAKFRKLEAFWRNIAPQEDAKPYKTINLKYNNQIICK